MPFEMLMAIRLLMGLAGYIPTTKRSAQRSSSTLMPSLRDCTIRSATIIRSEVESRGSDYR